MRNLKRALSLTLASVMLLGMMVMGTSAASFPDVDDNDNVEAIEVLKATGVMIGDNGNFKPDENVTRNEMAVIMTNLLGLNASDFAGTCPFTDVPNWAQNYVAACYNAGIVAGRTATTYDGSATVKNVEAAAMMLRALGYFKNTEDYTVNGGFTNATVRQAAAIRLFDGVTGNANDAMNRNNVAQLALNALESDMVEFTGNMGWEFNGITQGYQSKYEPRKDLNNNSNGQKGYNYTNDPANSTTHQKEYLQLCEDLYDGKLIKNTRDNDDFDRPATTWKFNGKVIGSYMNTPDLVYTAEVKLGDIYKDLGLNEAVAAGKVNFSRNGMFENVSNTMTQANNGTALSTLGLTKGDDANKIGANGVLTQVWYHSDTETADITMIDTWVGKISTVNKATGNTARSVTVGTTLTPNLNVNLNTKFETEDFAAKDVVLYTAAYNGSKYDIKTMEALGAPVTGKLTKWNGTTVAAGTGKSESSFAVDGETYKYDTNVVVVDDNASQIAGVWSFTVNESEINVYLDKYGYAIYVSGVEGETNYAAVIGTGSTNPYGDQTQGATLLLPDGTQKTVTAKVKNLKNANDTDANNTALSRVDAPTNNGAAQLVSDVVGDLVSYKVKDDGTYELTVLGYSNPTTSALGTYTGKYNTANISHKGTGSTDNDRSFFTNGKSAIRLGGNSYYVTSDTIFFVATKSGSDVVYNVYTGYNAMPTFGTDANDDLTGYAFKVSNEYTTQLDAVYIAADALGGTSAVDTYFVKKANAEIITDSTGSYYVLPAIVEGEVTEIKLDATGTIAGTNWSDNANVSGVFAIKNVVKDKNDIITNYASAAVFNASDSSTKVNPVTGTVGSRKGVLGLGASGSVTGADYWAYTSTTNAYSVSKDLDAITKIEVSAIGTDTDDIVYAKGDSDAKVLQDVIVVDVQPGTTPPPVGPVNSGTTIPDEKIDDIPLGDDFTPNAGEGEVKVTDYVVRGLTSEKVGSRLIITGDVGAAYQFDENSETKIAGYLSPMKSYFTEPGTPKTTGNGSTKIAIIAIEADNGEVFLWLVGNKTTDFTITHTDDDGTVYTIPVNVAGLVWK